MSKTGTKWPEETTLKFVESYSRAECLWDSGSSLYRCKDSRQTAYQKLAQEFGLSPTAVRFKIKNLRCTYHQELKRNAHKEGGPTLKWYNIMDTIMAQIGRKSKSPSSDVSQDCTESQSTQQNSELRAGVEDQTEHDDEIQEEERSHTPLGNSPSTDQPPAGEDQPDQLKNDGLNHTANEDLAIDEPLSKSPPLERNRSSDRIAQQVKRKADAAFEEAANSKRCQNNKKSALEQHNDTADNQDPPTEMVGDEMEAGPSQEAKRVSRATTRQKAGPSKRSKKSRIQKQGATGQQKDIVQKQSQERFCESTAITTGLVDLSASEQVGGTESGVVDPYLYSHNVVPSVTVMSIKREQPGWARSLVQTEQADADAAAQSRRHTALPHGHNPHHHEQNEFDVFGRSVSLQMQKMSTVTALRTKLKIQTILTDERVRELLDP